MIQIYHNNRCGKSRDCVAFLTDSDKEFEIINYLKTPPTFNELNDLLQKLTIKPIDLVRKKEKIWVINFKNKTLSDAEIIKAMVDNPILIERPIVVNGNKAVIARPLEKVDNVL